MCTVESRTGYAGDLEGPPARHSCPGAFYFVCAASLVGLATLAIFFRNFPESHFNLIVGDYGDNRFIMSILEHWRAFFGREASFVSPDFYWPQPGVLGYSDAFFLLYPPYALVRAAGVDSYIAFELTQIIFGGVGFFSMLWLLRSFVSVSRTVAVLGSCLFTLSNSYYLSAGHGQLMTVVFVPLLMCLLLAAWKAWNKGRRTSGYFYGASFGLLLASVLFTSFYIGWFFLFASGVTISSALLIRIFQTKSLSPLWRWIRLNAAKGPILLTAASVFSIAMIPFVITYLPALKETGGRSFHDSVYYGSHVWDLINVGRWNCVWGRVIQSALFHLAHGPLRSGETQVGWPPVTLGFIAAGAILAFQGLGSSYATKRDNQRFLTAVLSASFIVCWTLALYIHGKSLWWLVFKFIPGASAIRVPARFNLVLNVFVVIVISLVLNEFGERFSRARITFWALALILIAEQINAAPIHLINRASELAVLNRVPRPPSTCRSFFLARPATRQVRLLGSEVVTPAEESDINQIDAMLIARAINMPTLNGYSGWRPSGWNFPTFDQTYFENVRRWALDKHVTAGLCGLDLRGGFWSSTEFSSQSLSGISPATR